MLTLILVFSGALVIMLVAAALNRRRESAPYRTRMSETVDGASGGLLVMSGDGASDCASSDAGSGCDGGGGGGE